MQELIGNLTIEEFTEFMGAFIGCIMFYFFSLLLAFALGHAIIDGWLFRKGALYYGSLRHLNMCFKDLRNAKSVQLLDLANARCISAILLLRCQRVIPKIMYNRLLDKQQQIYHQRRLEIWNHEKDYNVFSY